MTIVVDRGLINYILNFKIYIENIESLLKTIKSLIGDIIDANRHR